MASSSNLLLNTAVLCLSVIPDHRLTTSIKIVVVLIPPAVEPGEPPININTQVSNFDAEVRLPVSTLLKPAVLAVVAEKATQVYVLPHSYLSWCCYIRLYKTVTFLKAVKSRGNKYDFGMESVFLKCRPLVVISSHTTKPIPPMIINESITTFTTTSPA